MDISQCLSLLLALLFIFAIVQCLGSAQSDVREPPNVSSILPILGHVVGLIRHGLPYLSSRTKESPPIVTFNFGVAKIYVVNTANMVKAVQRNYSSIWSEPVLETAAHRMAGVNSHGVKILKQTESGGVSISKYVVHAMQPALLGSGLDKMNQTMANQICVFMAQLDTSRPVDLYLWLRHVVTVASTKAVWGPLNPFDHPYVEDAFWDYDTDLGTLLLGILPNITARKAYYGREKVVASFIKYYAAGGQYDSSSLAYARWKTQHEAGIPTEVIARLETATAVAVLSNTVVTAFWMLFDIYSRPDLLSALRHELDRHALSIDPETGHHNIDIARMREKCPALISTFQEVLRFRSIASPMRVVKQDTLLNDRYLLKANAILLMPSRSINYESDVWGKDADSFDPFRFVDTGAAAALKRSANSFMAFGTAPGLCPGRHFATGEVLAIVAMTLLKYEICPVKGDGSWTVPLKLNMRAVASTLSPPAEAFEVNITPRSEVEEQQQWSFVVTGGKGRFGLVTG